ncbi:MAG: PD-(D/E)XK nuclease family protein [Candidatus Sericytochromatia bacterium]|nr:PD-(D/E)XK nuclease family protein [Candidatus Sericytochromatia bacterium]
MPSLHLLPWSRLAPGEAVAGRRVLTPNARAARALGVDACSLVRHATTRLRQAGAPPVASALEAQVLLREAVRRSWRGGADVEGRARGVAPVIRGWLRAGADLRAIVTAGPPRAQAIARIAEAYVAALAEAGRLEPAQVLRAAAAVAGEREDLLVTGYPRLGWDEAAYVEAVAGPATRVLLPDAAADDGRPAPAYAGNRALAARWRSAGWEVVEAGGGPAFAPGAPVVVRSHADEEAELRGALADLKQLLLAGVRPSECVLVARDDAAIGPLAAAIADEYGVPLQLHYRVPLPETRLGTWLEALLAAAAAGFDPDATLALLAHPLTGLGGPGDLDLAALRRHAPRGVAAWEAHGVPLTPLAPPAGPAPAAAWGAWLSQALRAARVAARARPWASATLALQALHRALPALQEGAESLGLEAFTARLREAARHLAVPCRPRRGGVSLHTPLALFGARVRHVFVVGMAEGVLPAPVADSHVLDFHDVAALGVLGVPVEDAAGAAGRELTSFAALVATATEALVLSHPRMRGGKLALPSPYLEAFGPPVAMTQARLLASREEVRRHGLGADALGDDALAPALVAALAVERAREGAAAHGPHEGVSGVAVDPARHLFSASQLTTLGQCPFRWFVSHGLRLAPPEDEGDGLSERRRGELYHAALQHAVEAAGDAPSLRDAVVAALPAALEAARVALALPETPAWERQRPGHVRLLEAAVRAPGFLAEGARPVACEQGFKASWRGLRLTGRIDRIDRDAAGRLLLLDYKTGGTPPSGARDDEGRLKLDLQLPIYVQAAAPALFPGEPVGEAAYYSLGKGEVLEVGVPSPEALDAFVAGVRARLAAGAFPVSPDAKREACTWCDHRPICRIGPGHERKPQEASR